ncbi:hypothetical protein GLOIN_2v1692646 [Rhizophagus irregularis DAOM 181602=DAOM 197198]|uniref:ATP-dependent DNA helicase n=1 Tax=Rhizophagus irregularis (strain DAOM 181602 / DAOM 197198 / MUCL 43194) TaxID=747089 RepID=A0A2P4PBN9_RHIID|nr:hypothetical protein GLOIN_2v1692646 [Rhizophagus irregularis DAOM 181602=DAOM 197198]POG62790.1 hypothetical protein GLOIN_2v1692646 [Rhizophagus irregularis DAOM 181602=DAOM 197198]|eukprot:XP_025169656.1 hypothetical protein GLOIN_2v1692646 [Rhizophagus irregularis DAOM 181602=DAOM 197198]
MLLAEMMPNRQTRSLDDLGQKASSSRQLVTTSIDLRTLSEKQRLIRERVESIAPLRIIVMGTAGTGKSYLINVIQGRLYEIAKEHNLHENNMVVAPTGVAALTLKAALYIRHFLFQYAG